MKTDTEVLWLGFIIIALVLILIFLSVPKTEGAENIIAQVIAAEAGGEGYEGMYAVACVIQNRMQLFGMTAEEVVTQKNQFFGYTAKNRHANYLAVKHVADALAERIGTLRDITGGALHFENIKTFGVPAWAKSKKVLAVVGSHTFF